MTCRDDTPNMLNVTLGELTDSGPAARRRQRSGAACGRRDILSALGLSAAALAMSMAGGAAMAKAQGERVAINDADVLNFALNLEYLEAEYYARGAWGRGLDSQDIGGHGAPGSVVGGRQVRWNDRTLRNFAIEIAGEEVAHVKLLRRALGGARVARPMIDLNASFTAAARAAGVIGPAEDFDPFASEVNFMLGAFLLEDVGVNAYKGAAGLIQNKALLDAAAGLLAVEASHAGAIRATLYARGVFEPPARIAAARDRLAGGVRTDMGIGDANHARIAPVDSQGLVFGRTPAQVLSIVYLNPRQSPGGFFPRGMNGTVR